jgi:hypothetical protein
VTSLENGNISLDTINYIKNLERNIQVKENTLHLFARHCKTTLFNHDKLQLFPGTVKIFESQDEGDSHHLQRFQAPKRLGLKVGCPVMLVVNLSNVLVNGSIGKVKDFLEDKIVVYFPKPDITVTLSQYAFTKIDPVSRKTLAKRLQFPLILSFGITIHKSQGMSLESVVVDCENANIPGQIGVALGRAITAENLQVKNFSAHLVTKHPQKVYNFYKVPSKDLLPDCSCCKNEFISSDVLTDLFIPIDWNLTNDYFDAEIINDDDNADADDDFDDSFCIDDDEILLNFNLDQDSSVSKDKVHTASPIPDNISPVEILNEIKEEYNSTPLDESMTNVIEEVKTNMIFFIYGLQVFFYI